MLVSATTYFVLTITYVTYNHKGISWFQEQFKTNRSYIALLAVTTFFGLFIANLLYLYCVKHAHNINVVNVVMAMYPVVTLILASVFLKEHLDPMGFLGFLLILAGIAILLYTSHQKRI